MGVNNDSASWLPVTQPNSRLEQEKPATPALNAQSQQIAIEHPQNTRSVDEPKEVQPSQQSEELMSYPSEHQLEQLEALSQRLNRELKFELDEESGEQVVYIFSKQTGELIRQIPAQELLELNTKLAQHPLTSLSEKI
ncbi:flagellar protein FlaG [Photobacterium gaetbulicola]|uniref:flagellar protein FlaG n=1 Tax=Photobacterium gaetbulicola TaxID=1295392 RepID=UPI00069102C6|nr:flagellar protein FlaG [Photobacterium gaetbulicola]